LIKRWVGAAGTATTETVMIVGLTAVLLPILAGLADFVTVIKLLGQHLGSSPEARINGLLFDYFAFLAYLWIWSFLAALVDAVWPSWKRRSIPLSDETARAD
jgi:hypothetical protein